MKIYNSNLDFSVLRKAHNYFFNNQFEKAQIEFKLYCSQFRYSNFKKVLANKKINTFIKISIILVTYQNEKKLQNCLYSIKKSSNKFIEIILISNRADIGSNIINLVDNFIEIGDNILPSEARNIGSLSANGTWLYFLDDDSEVHTKTIEYIFYIISTKKFFAARGKIFPLNKIEPKYPSHYDLGDQVLINAKLTTEGNLLIKKSLFLSAGGFDPLMYAHEGLDLTYRCNKVIDSAKIIYHPNIIIHHDQKVKKEMEKKSKRNKIGADFILFKEENNLNDISGLIFITGESADKHLGSLLSSIANEMEGRDVNIVVLTKHIEKALLLSKFFMGRLKIIVSYPKVNNFWNHINQCKSSYFCILNYAESVESIDLSNALNESLEKNVLANVYHKQNKIGKLGWLISEMELRPLSEDISQDKSTYIEKYLKSVFVGDDDNSSKLHLQNTQPSYKDIIVTSFHTKDNYYTKKAYDLKSRLNLLGIKHDIRPIEIPTGMKWPDICRKKTSYMFEAFKRHKDRYKKLIWIDVDCNLDFFPNFIVDFDVDFMAFGRGFRTSKSSTKKKYTRRWEPCFFVFSMNHKCMDLLRKASDLEKKMKDIQATDDYFFEESWRENGAKLTTFEIPGEMSTRREPKNIYTIQRKSKGIFFIFGDSGNVSEFKGKVEQHEPDLDTEDKKFEVKAGNNPLLHLIEISAENKKNLNNIENTLGTGASELQRELVRSLRSYESKGVSIPLHWWIRPAPGNMGDWLSPYIINKLTGFPVCYKNAKASKIVSLGSIGKFIQDHHIVWGTGISSQETDLNAKAKYLAVRGPYTAEAIKKSGGNAPDIFGDPGILLRNIYEPKLINGLNFKYGIVRHFIHQDCDIQISEDVLDINIMLSSSNDIENFINILYSLKAVVTTSLHVNIICQAYKIPCRLINLKNQIQGVHGDGIKYRDFYEGVGLKYLPHADQAEIINPNFIESVVSNDFISENSFKDLTSVLYDQLRNYPNTLLHEG